MEKEAVTGFYSPVLTSYLVFCFLKAPALKAFKEGQISPHTETYYNAVHLGLCSLTRHLVSISKPGQGL